MHRQRAIRKGIIANMSTVLHVSQLVTTRLTDMMSLSAAPPSGASHTSTIISWTTPWRILFHGKRKNRSIIITTSLCSRNLAAMRGSRQCDKSNSSWQIVSRSKPRGSDMPSVVLRGAVEESGCESAAASAPIWLSETARSSSICRGSRFTAGGGGGRFDVSASAISAGGGDVSASSELSRKDHGGIIGNQHCTTLTIRMTPTDKFLQYSCTVNEC